MKKIIQLVMFMYLLLSPVIGLAGEFTFYGIKFGMSKEEIQKLNYKVERTSQSELVYCKGGNCYSCYKDGGSSGPPMGIGDTYGLYLKFDNEEKLFHIKVYYSYSMSRLFRNGSAEEKEARLSAITEKSKEFVSGDKDVKTEIIEVEEKSLYLLQFVHVPLRNRYIDFLKAEMLNKMGLNITPPIVERKFPR